MCIVTGEDVSLGLMVMCEGRIDSELINGIIIETGVVGM